MTISIQLPAESGTRLREAADRSGKNVEQFLESLNDERLAPPPGKSASHSLTARESALFSIINRGFSKAFWATWKSLDQKRQAATLSESELAELLKLNEQLEKRQAKRLVALAELAEIRGLDLDALMSKLGLLHGSNR